MFGSTQAMKFTPIAVAWLLTIGVDLFFNAGLFAGLFDQSKEPSLLADEVLFRRIPVAYIALAVAVIVLAWLVDRLDVLEMRHGLVLGALAGGVAALLGIVSLWTAIDMTGAFVLAGALVQVVELGVAGAFLGAYRGEPEPRRWVRRGLALAVTLVVLGIVFQNVFT